MQQGEWAAAPGPSRTHRRSRSEGAGGAVQDSASLGGFDLQGASHMRTISLDTSATNFLQSLQLHDVNALTLVCWMLQKQQCWISSMTQQPLQLVLGGLGQQRHPSLQEQLRQAITPGSRARALSCLQAASARTAGTHAWARTACRKARRRACTSTSTASLRRCQQ
ncbi:hypothetical protein COO60DRAFT_1067931 [Scenedesmus sp. NREL 46B-D3]|nr:hypothetical protein COO60DRAFT_1067931 [Scenedesmus sp. NREL 46B-D3]